ncbi:hypothetical protein SAMN05216436_105100 [bacterium A37T11]|nr:hypothetical protein SAMN05216436_105100 [bacterium A37T11]
MAEFSRMNRHNTIKSLGIIACLTTAFIQQDVPFSNRQALGKIQDPELNELSGITASMHNPQNYWVHNDSGDKARIFLINDSAQRIATYYLSGIIAHDWEDIGRRQHQGKAQLLIGDIGDNLAKRSCIQLHVLDEPLLRPLAKKPYSDTIPAATISTYVLKYADGPRDAESFFYDESDQQLYILSKRDLQAGVYSTPLPGAPNRDTLILHKRTTIPHTFITSADLSSDGTELLVKDLLHVYYWKRKPGETIVHMLARPAISLPYKAEPQGEAIAFLTDGSAYVTISEEVLGLPAILYRYRRIGF